ncbi:MAG: HAD family hydrolase [Bacilli bacterium]|nr:HAD family hydrolase [Bacilli bacterium]
MNKYKAILFDLDGTLCDTDEMIVQTMRAIYLDYKPRKIRTRGELYYFSGPPIRETLKNEFPDYDPEMMHEVFKRVSKGFYPSTVKAFEGEIEVLKTLKEKGYLLGVVTNKGLPLTKYSLELCHIESFFDVIISADDVAIPKPDPSGVLKAMEFLNIKNKGDVLYVGDNDIDYFTAENAGVDCMLVSWGPRVIKCIDQAKYEAKSYNEMRDILL